MFATAEALRPDQLVVLAHLAFHPFFSDNFDPKQTCGSAPTVRLLLLITALVPNSLSQLGVGSLKSKYLVLLTAVLPTAAPASVIVLGNYKTGEVIIEGNAPGGAEADRAVALAKGGSDAGWTQIYGPDDDRQGWGTVLCVRHKQGYFFAEAIGETSEQEADRTVNLKANRFLARLVGGDDAALIEMSATWPEMARQAAANGIGEKIKCAPAWNNQGQQISHTGKPLNMIDPPRQSAAVTAAEDSTPMSENAAQMGDASEQQLASAPSLKRDYEAEYQAKVRAWEQQQAEHRRKVEEHEEAKRQIEERKIRQREQAQGVLGEYQRQLAEHAAAEAAFAEEHKRWQTATQQQVLGSPNASGSGTGIADSFKVQNDAEWLKVSNGLPGPRDFPGHPWAYCYQPSSVDSVLYHTHLFATKKQKTELELGFADEVAKITRISSAMSTHCHVSNDATYLDRLRANVVKVHASKRPEPLAPPR